MSAALNYEDIEFTPAEQERLNSIIESTDLDAIKRDALANLEMRFGVDGLENIKNHYREVYENGGDLSELRQMIGESLDNIQNGYAYKKTMLDIEHSFENSLDFNPYSPKATHEHSEINNNVISLDDYRETNSEPVKTVDRLELDKNTTILFKYDTINDSYLKQFIISGKESYEMKISKESYKKTKSSIKNKELKVKEKTKEFDLER